MPLPTLTILENLFSLHRFAASASIPKEATKAAFFAVVRSEDELSVIAPEELELKSERSEAGWACIRVNGPLKLNEVGVLAQLSTALAQAKVSLLAVWSYDTDYLFVKSEQLEAAKAALEKAGYKFRRARKKAEEEESGSLAALLKRQAPVVQKLLQEKVGAAALAALKSDEAWALAIGGVYEFLPAAVRLIVQRETFVNFFVHNRDLLLPARLRPTPEEAQKRPISTARAAVSKAGAAAKSTQARKRSK